MCAVLLFGSSPPAAKGGRSVADGSRHSGYGTGCVRAASSPRRLLMPVSRGWTALGSRWPARFSLLKHPKWGVFRIAYGYPDWFLENHHLVCIRILFLFPIIAKMLVLEQDIPPTFFNIPDILKLMMKTICISKHFRKVVSCKHLPSNL